MGFFHHVVLIIHKIDLAGIVKQKNGMSIFIPEGIIRLFIAYKASRNTQIITSQFPEKKSKKIARKQEC